MKKPSQLLTTYPEYILIALVILYWASTVLINPVAIGLLSLLILQVIFKNRISGLIIGLLFVFINLFLVLAIGSELFEFPVFNTNAKKLLIYGFLILGICSMATGLMLYKHFLNENKKPPAVQ